MIGPVGTAAAQQPSVLADGSPTQGLPLPQPQASGEPSPGALLVVLGELLMQSRNTTLELKQEGVQRYGQQCQSAIDAACDAQKRAADADADNGGLFSDIEKACGDVLDDAVHLRVVAIVSDVKDDTVCDPQFWKDLASTGATVAKWAAVVGSVALAVGLTATGAGAPAAGLAIAAAVMTVAGATESEFGVLEKLGVDPKAAQWIGLGLSVGGAAVGAGAGIVASGAQNAQAANAAAGVSGSAGADASEASATAADKVVRVTQETGVAVDQAAGAAGVVGGIGRIGVGYFESESLDAQADVTAATQNEARLRRLIEAVQKAMLETYQDATTALAGVSSTMNKMNEAKLNTWRMS